MAINIRQTLGTLALSSLMLVATPVLADFNAGMRALEAGNYGAAITAFTVDAERNHAPSQLRLGELYRNGQGTRPDPIVALKWLTLSYLNGSREALPILEALRDRISEEQIVEGEQMALKWLEESNRIMFADDDTDSLYQQF